jgi:uncharacterized protein (UPF0371 family)
LIVKANIETATTQREIMAMGFGFDINQQDNCFLQVMKAPFICGKQMGKLATCLMLVYNQVVGRVHVYYQKFRLLISLLYQLNMPLF